MNDDASVARAFDELAKDDPAVEELRSAARRAIAFLAACVEGQIAEATVGERIAAARSLLEHAAKQPDLAGELAAIADLAGEDDVSPIVSALD